MKVIGSPEEIEWAKQALLNNCESCPYEKRCTATAVKEQEKYGEVHQSCRDYITQQVEFITSNNNI